ncbi:hypothetical protein LCGC14_3051050 [marine sediment metagenome]|uniref:Uncharacterized protein n=1 Tax=marine sediment metagenome TaxID=412755 RepID=A0A0F8WLM0_9ZZZZ
MLLTIKYRLLLMNILPDNGNHDTLRIIRKQQESLGISEEEHKRLKVRREGSIIRWDESQDAPVEIEIGEVAGHIIKRELTRLDSDGQLQMEFLPLYEHFVEGEDWALDSDAAEATSEPSAEPTPIKEPEPRTTKEALGGSPLAEGSKD